MIINHPEFILISLLIVSLSVLIVVKNWYGFLICLLGILMTGALLYFGQIQIFNFIGGALIGFLILGAFIDLKVIFHKNEEL
ncbi:M50 family metallopeptidase, partial [Mycobacterium kansasii]